MPTQVTDAGIIKLIPLQKLEDLQLTGTLVTDKGLMELIGLHGLSRIHTRHPGDGRRRRDLPRPYRPDSSQPLTIPTRQAQTT